MPCRPLPRGVALGSNPVPSSVTSNESSPSLAHSRASARVACAYFATFCSASRQEKYTADSTSCGYRATPSGDTLTGSGDLRACASRAAASPLSASSGG